MSERAEHLTTTNPTTGEQLERYALLDDAALEKCLEAADEGAGVVAAMPLEERCQLARALAARLRERKEELARLTTLEMGKLIGEARAEVDKCAWVLEHYADEGPRYLEPTRVVSDASKSLVVPQPLGPVFAVMPWNFPLWQVFRFAAPALVAGNVGLLKHAANVTGVALAIESLYHDVDAPRGAFQTLVIDHDQAHRVITDRRVRAATLTGSERAGRAIGAAAGETLKKTVLELGGSDAFVVLEDAELDEAAEQAVASRFINAGQSCIAAKRLIVVEKIADAFLERALEHVRARVAGDPIDEATTLAPMAREDLRGELEEQVRATVERGARLVAGGRPAERAGFFYEASLLVDPEPGTPAYADELFGPVAVVMRVPDERSALARANDSRFGLGGAVWSRDVERAERFALSMEAGACFVNGIVKSDPRLPFGGVKDSGHGRELSREGILEFTNQKTLWVR